MPEVEELDTNEVSCCVVSFLGHTNTSACSERPDSPFFVSASSNTGATARDGRRPDDHSLHRQDGPTYPTFDGPACFLA